MYLPFTILLPFVFTILSPYFVSLTHSKVARLGISTTTRPTETVFASADNSDLNFFYYDQNLDHFTFTPKSYQTFQQRYVINAKHWAGSKANAPIFAFLGEEASIESDLYVGFFQDNGPRLKALLVYIEHRYYGKSVPFGSAEEALKNASTLGYLNAAQALADYAAILMHVKEKYSAKHSPIIVVGGSYGGMLAAWFRLKYPHIALGALASSAPLLYFEDTRPKFGYYHIITKVFKETSKRCYKTIRKSWKEIDRVAAKSNGLLILSKKFKTCAPLSRSFDIKDFLDSIYAESVQFNGNPGDWVATLCNAIDNPTNRKNYGCSEIVMPIGHDKHDTMFQTAPFNMTIFIDDCKSKYGVSPRPHWITTYFGIQDIKLILRRFGSNIIFSNGLADPYSVGGVLENVSGTVVALKTLNGTHCQDLSSRRKDDPKWLVMQREKEIKTIESWISTYQKDLRVARLGIFPTTRPTETVLEKTETSDLKFFYYDQILDHFSFTPESYQTFQQRYAVDSKHWAGANASAPILAFLGEEAWLEVDLHDVVLAAWFRLKYPHIALGALASSAPLLYFEDTRPNYGYYHVITNVFKETSERCYKTIRKSWREIDRVAAKSNGLLILSKKFRTCAPLSRSFDIKDFLDSIYAESVQFNRNPGDWVATLCNAIDNPPNRKNYATSLAMIPVCLYSPQTMSSHGVGRHSCSEIMMPIGHDKHDTMFQTAPFNMTSAIDNCKSSYGVSPRPHWVTTYFGIQDVKLILRRFGSNIIFSNGLADPYSVGGVLEDVTDSIVAIKTLKGTHSQDLSTRRKDDPEWLIPRLGISPKMLKNEPDAPTQKLNDPDLKMFYFNQNLDHFTFTPKSYMTFQQRYAIDSKHWAGAKDNAPILAFLGEESSLDSDLSAIDFLRDNGPRLKALLVYIEHRYYGKTMPFGSAEEALKNASTLGYLNAAQALADYASILLHVKEKYSTKHSPIIVIGGSYGGMLAAWFRLKYPHIALGALASSAPLLYFEDTRPKFGYYYIVTKVIKGTSERCYNMIRKSWKEIDRVAAKPNGLLILSKQFKTCAPLNASFDIKDFLSTIYAEAVQYNRGPSYSVTNVCNAIDNNPPNSKKGLLDRIFAGAVALLGNQSCYDTNIEIVMPVGYDKQDTMFPTTPFNMTSYIEGCKADYGVTPRPHWITTYFGIQDVKLILRKFGSNIIFSNGLSDPYSVGGVLEDISDSVVAIKSNNGSHCQDIVMKMKGDPEWLVMQRDKEIKIIESWISTYQKDLKALNISI
ncbi:hypothetical protein IGI04_005217 [Brassica rapa subsp. trilocularis]|uniref:Serine carboxypeptidase S28 family protein n=1 Tax=Brassica rapa subsp. trilocularis TaxID=1813537 RepID=A0ABQ7NDZ8_BRACM|nr:hypothetical protein IGI04_005217 [Brassica rapa subsp. trilocularis]